MKRVNTALARLSQETGLPVSRYAEASDGYFVVLDHFMARQSRIWANLVLIDLSGKILWRKECPSLPDTFVGVEWNGEKLTAWTGNGYRLDVEPVTGNINGSEFVK